MADMCSVFCNSRPPEVSGMSLSELMSSGCAINNVGSIYLHNFTWGCDRDGGGSDWDSGRGSGDWIVGASSFGLKHVRGGAICTVCRSPISIICGFVGFTGSEGPKEEHGGPFGAPSSTSDVAI